MTTPDYRAALAELLDAVTRWDSGSYDAMDEAMARARALLSAHEAVGVTDADIRAAFIEGAGFWLNAEGFMPGIRAVLSRCGTAYPAPVPVGERLWELRSMFERILSKARCMETRTVGNIELADRLLDAVADWALPLPGAQP